MFTRRGFLHAALTPTITPWVWATLAPGASASTAASSAAETNAIFPQSVASGDPSPSGVMLWTRVAPAAAATGQTLAFEVADDSGFQRIVVNGVIPASAIRADRDYTIQVDLTGLLKPNRRYWYRFRYAETVSRVGRCRTLPHPWAVVTRVRFGVLTCQDYSNGYYPALAQLARQDVDFVLHLGDFIYETVGDPRFQELPYPERALQLPSQQRAVTGLDDYRFLYRTYRSDPQLQALLEQHTLVALWDDHETANDCYWDYDRDTLGAPDHPLQAGQPNGGDAGALRRLKREAMQAWSEYMPARVVQDPQAAHPHDYLQIYRSFRFGTLLELFVTDERTYRSAPPCGLEDRYVTTGCGGQTDASRSMLGAEQRDWLLDGLTGSAALWKVWANEVFLGQLKIGRGANTTLFFNVDAWDGFEAERRLILQTCVNERVRNLVALTGDLHSTIASTLKIDYAQRENRPSRNIAGVELMTPAVTSSTLVQKAINLLTPDERRALFGSATTPDAFLFERAVRQANPHIQLFNGQDWGYMIVDFTAWQCSATVYRVDPSSPREDAPVQILRQLRVPVFRPVLEQS